MNSFLSSVHLFYSPQFELSGDLARALIKREREQNIASVTLGMGGRAMGVSNTPCQIKRDLLVEHLTMLERLKVAERAHKEIVAGGTSDGAAARSGVRILAIKALSSLARAKYAEHCQAHRC